MPWTVIVNPAAGRGRTRRLLPELARAVTESGFDTQLVVSADPSEPAALAEAAAHAERDLVAVGGDGVAGVVAGVAATTGRRFTVVPTGSGNDFARALGISVKRPLDALRVLGTDGRDVVIDLGRVNGRPFTTVAATGFDAEANRWANSVTSLSGTPLYLAAVVRTLATYRPRRFRLTIDASSYELDAWLLATANGPAYGGGMRIAPEAELDDGLLDVIVIGPLSVPRFLIAFPRVFGGTHVTHPAVSCFRGARVRIESLDGDLDVFADGERVGPMPAALEAWRRALTVRVPADSPLA
jgi:diacylglycerol kinase (ATP)